MRNLFLVPVALLCGAALATGQNHEWADKLFTKGGSTHNFGNVPRGAVLNYRFPITNIYAVPLDIVGTRVSCGCVTVTPSSTTLQPKESGYIDITMDARRFTGPKTVNIFITVGPQYTSTATLQVSANSRADVVFNPGQVSFGLVPAGQTPSQTIDVEYAGVLDWRITGLAELKAPLDVKYRELYREQGRSGYRLQVTLKDNAPPGPFKYEVLLQTNDPASLLVPVLIEGNIQAALTVFPPVVPLKNIQVGQEVAHKVLVNGNGDKLFRILQVEGAPEGMTVEFPPAAAKVQVLTIKCRPTVAGPLKCELRVKTDLDGGAVATIAVDGNSVQ
jgi:hypothetical protein